VKHTLSVLVENRPGALMRISSMFARRGFNIESLSVGVTERHDVSRITMRVDCEQHPLEQIEKQMHKLVNVLRVSELEPGEAVLLDGLVPHYSDANRTERPRRVLVASYAPEREHYTRTQYYAARNAVMTTSSAADGRFRISTLADFEGAEVAPDAAAIEQCTHEVNHD